LESSLFPFSTCLAINKLFTARDFLYFTAKYLALNKLQKGAGAERRKLFEG
jgi:hypothetical protein